MGKLEEALEEMTLAKELDPLSLIINADFAQLSYYARRYDQAIEAARKTLELDPNYGDAYMYLGVAQLSKSNYEEALRAFEKCESLGLALGPRIDIIVGFIYIEHKLWFF